MPPLTMSPFLRDIGRHFSINRMIKAESYRQRIESEEGLSFIEFNYMLLQAYDFSQTFLTAITACSRWGGSDQWGNILAGVDLIRKTRQENRIWNHFQTNYQKRTAVKMGKTASGAVWLDPEKKPLLMTIINSG